MLDYGNQSSTRSCATLSKSDRFRLSSVAWFTVQILAIFRSMEPMRILACLSDSNLSAA